MKQPMKLSAQGAELIKHFESCYLTAYQDEVGVWTIGWGHTGLTHNDGTVHRGRTITRDQAEELFRHDMAVFEETVNRLVAEKVALSQGQFDAMVSFAFNLGEGNLSKSTLLRKLNAGEYFGALEEFPKWCHAAGKTERGLVRRRLSEQRLFCSFPFPILTELPK